MNFNTLIQSKLNLIPIETLNDEGKNSVVIIAHDKQLDSDFIVKCIKKSSFNGNLNDYFTESKMIYASAHPNVVCIQHASFDDNYIYLTMPYYRSGSLNALLDKRFLSVREIISIALDILTGLNHIHTKHIVHLDVKPTNILFANNGTAMITDFGEAKYTDKYGMAENTHLYLAHMAPEFFSTTNRTIQYDIYSIGLTLYRMCNGNDNFKLQLSKQFDSNPTTNEELFSILKNCITSSAFPNRKYFLPHIPKKLQKIIIKALSINPEDRYNNCIELMNCISNIPDSYFLDVKYSLNDHLHKWEYTHNDTLHTITYDEDSLTMNALNTKGSSHRKNSALCKSNMNKANAFKLIATALNQ